MVFVICRLSPLFVICRLLLISVTYLYCHHCLLLISVCYLSPTPIVYFVIYHQASEQSVVYTYHYLSFDISLEQQASGRSVVCRPVIWENLFTNSKEKG